MVYFCADDYGISKEYNRCIEACLSKGCLNKVSILPNGDFEGFAHIRSDSDAVFALHLNLVEGHPLSQPQQISLLVDEKGCFKRSFSRLALLSLSPKRKELEKQLYTEIKNQLLFWKQMMGDEKSISIDSHQHAYMIPLVFKTMLKVIEDEKINVGYLRIPAEPLLPYILAPSLYTSYKPVGIIKQWLLKLLALINSGKLRKSKIKSAYFMGVMLSGKLNKQRVQKLLTHYLRLAEKHGKSIEIGFHPGSLSADTHLIDGSRKDFQKFYCSPWRVTEYETLMDDELYKITKEGRLHAIY